MANTGYIKKRPCKICRKWFVPNPRLGVRQKTCGAEECKAKWHAKKCTQWNRQNREYFQTNHLNKKLQASQDQEVSSENPSSQAQNIGKSPQLPRGVIQEVIGVQQFVIIEYIAQLLSRRVQEVMRRQVSEMPRESGRLLQDGCSRCDRSMRPP
ncbi:MAG: hypothetical protein GY702_28830 [Desulfobulbaceae bacterium]|nr:hypothetical protein [Desulfobulbaceae bacterium]